MTQVKRLNYKTLEEFKQFKEYGIQELSMLEDLESNMIENDSNSPFYGIYFGDKLVYEPLSSRWLDDDVF